MENKQVKKINRSLKIAAWLDLTVAILSVISIICVLITKETSIAGHIMKDLVIIMDSLLLAFVSSKTKVTAVEEESK